MKNEKSEKFVTLDIGHPENSPSAGDPLEGAGA